LKNQKSILNFAQIGIGYWGPNLLRNLSNNTECKIESAVDLPEERLNYVKNFDNSILTSKKIEDVLSDESIDAVVISTPVATHFSIAKSCLEHGKHILVEKPLTTKVSAVKNEKEEALFGRAIANDNKNSKDGGLL